MSKALQITLPQRRRRYTGWIVAALAVGIPGAVIAVGLMQQGLSVVTTPPPADGEPGRWIDVAGAENVRDIGGYKTADGRTVRHKLVYRSGTLSHVTPEGCETFREMGVATVVDMRNRLAALPLYNGDVFCVFQQASVYGKPVSFENEVPREERYLDGLLGNADAFRETFELLAEPKRLPLLYHCAAGTDRTGVMTALLLSLLGVDRETIFEDFLLSEQVGHAGNPEAMQALLDRVEADGGIDAFLGSLGVPQETLEAIRDELLK